MCVCLSLALYVSLSPSLSPSVALSSPLSPLSHSLSLYLSIPRCLSPLIPWLRIYARLFLTSCYKYTIMSVFYLYFINLFYYFILIVLLHESGVASLPAPHLFQRTVDIVVKHHATSSRRWSFTKHQVLLRVGRIRRIANAHRVNLHYVYGIFINICYS